MRLMKVIAATVVASLSISTGAVANAHEGAGKEYFPGAGSSQFSSTGTKSGGTLASNDRSLDDSAEGLTELLLYYDSIPDEVLQQGDSALVQWQEEHPHLTTRASKLACTGAIAWLVGSNLFGAAKIIKIKKYIKELGGVREAVKAMAGASFSEEAMKEAGGALKGLALEIAGVTAVREACFE